MQRYVLIFNFAQSNRILEYNIRNNVVLMTIILDWARTIFEINDSGNTNLPSQKLRIQTNDESH